jgi:8-amino-7-oxononanoate synthase
VRPIDATHLEFDGRRYVNFSSNNYLALSWHPRLRAAAAAAIRDGGFGSGAAGLIRGHTSVHESAARALARWKGTEDAVLLPSGYQANFSAVQTLAAISKSPGRRPVRFMVDKLVHASILDAVMATGLPVRVFPHNNLNKLARLLDDGEHFDVVATESIFSMDGDAADLAGLAALKKRRPFFLLLDEAHGSGVYGKNGAGYAQALGLQASVDASVVTLSKALGGVGGAICASKTFCRGVVNFGRAYIYSTSLPAAAAAAAQAAIGIMCDEPDRQTRLSQLARRARAELTAAGVNMPAGDSPILCCLMGAESTAIEAAGTLREQGMLVAAVRPPTVAPGSSRLRISLCSEHTDQEVNELLKAIRTLCLSTSPTAAAPASPARRARSSAGTNRAEARRRADR